MAQHAFLSPSAAARWLFCPAAPTLETFFPKKESGYMHEGTVAHIFAADAAAEALTRMEVRVDYDERHECDDDFTAVEWATNEAEECEYDIAEMKRHAQGYARFICSLVEAVARPDDRITADIETRAQIDAKCFGTADCVVRVGNHHKIVVDYKYGQGYKVDAVNNYQMMIYAVGTGWASHNILAIYQPRFDEDSPASVWNIRGKELWDWRGRTLRRAIEAALDISAPCHAGEWCRWCGAFARCRAAAEDATNHTTARHLADPRLMLPSEIADRLARAADSGTERWLATAKETLTRHLRDGASVAGWWLAPGASRRYITDPDALAGRLRSAGVPFDDVYQLASLTALEKAVGKKRFSIIADGLIDSRTSAPTLRRDTAGEAANITRRAMRDFADLDPEILNS